MADALVQLTRRRPAGQLRLCGIHGAWPAEFLPQARRPGLSAIFLLPSSSPASFAHRRLAGKTQARHSLRDVCRGISAL